MIVLPVALVVAGLFPISIAWLANRETSLRHAIVWAAFAWVSWIGVALWPERESSTYIAMSLTGCAGVAVLGARRPHVLAWNFVVFGLLAVLLLPLAEGLVIEVHSFNVERKVFLSVLVGLTIANFIPTRFVLATVSLGIACAIAGTWMLFPPTGFAALGAMSDRRIVALLALATPIAAWAARTAPVTNEFDADWFAFRDRYGFVWAMHVLDQFSRAAANANLTVDLQWGGLKDSTRDRETIKEAKRILASLTKRFMRPSEPEA